MLKAIALSLLGGIFAAFEIPVMDVTAVVTAVVPMAIELAVVVLPIVLPEIVMLPAVPEVTMPLNT